MLIVRTSTQESELKMAYNNNQSTAVVKREPTALTVPAEAPRHLRAMGLPDSIVGEMTNIVIAAGVNPAIMAHAVNVRAIVEARGYIHDLGYRVGKDFYCIVSDTDHEVYDQEGFKVKDGNFTKKTKIPTLSLIVDYKRLVENAKKAIRINYGSTFVREYSGIIEDKDRAAALIDLYYPNANQNKANRVGWCRFDFMVGNSLIKGEEHYGFYLADGVKKKGGDGDQAGSADPDRYMKSRGPANIAITRAIRAACRAETAEMYPIDNRSPEARMAEVRIDAQITMERLDRLIEATGVSVDEALEQVHHETSSGFEEVVDLKRDSIPTKVERYVEEETGEILYKAPTRQAQVPAIRQAQEPVKEFEAVKVGEASIFGSPGGEKTAMVDVDALAAEVNAQARDLSQDGPIPDAEPVVDSRVLRLLDGVTNSITPPELKAWALEQSVEDDTEPAPDNYKLALALELGKLTKWGEEDYFYDVHKIDLLLDLLSAETTPGKYGKKFAANMVRKIVMEMAGTKNKNVDKVARENVIKLSGLIDLACDKESDNG